MHRATQRAFFFFNDPAPPEISPLSLHDALPIPPTASSPAPPPTPQRRVTIWAPCGRRRTSRSPTVSRSEEHTSELQSQSNLVCRLLLEKKTIDLHRREPILPAPCGHRAIQHLPA